MPPRFQTQITIETHHTSKLNGLRTDSSPIPGSVAVFLEDNSPANKKSGSALHLERHAHYPSTAPPPVSVTLLVGVVCNAGTVMCLTRWSHDVNIIYYAVQEGVLSVHRMCCVVVPS